MHLICSVLLLFSCFNTSFSLEVQNNFEVLPTLYFLTFCIPITHNCSYCSCSLSLSFLPPPPPTPNILLGVGGGGCFTVPGIRLLYGILVSIQVHLRPETFCICPPTIEPHVVSIVLSRPEYRTPNYYNLLS